jgi:hypothetical protein
MALQKSGKDPGTLDLRSWPGPSQQCLRDRVDGLGFDEGFQFYNSLRMMSLKIDPEKERKGGHRTPGGYLTPAVEYLLTLSRDPGTSHRNRRPLRRISAVVFHAKHLQ